ncbi:succinate dehydrogenase, cytochrome b556 subunit [Arsenicitalea aurantiaca]|uniref:Succinate dehydrogenase cytochrome b556 subunit n=1 Tax=Arsenicitalea aurantiaca TaxID=1783274 RepID=A0A433X5J8_9HYPH|nr:succinate dehydrogenase, cytochrome b556 subunit [Arsenicitalea aurantiaca]RUT29321.1 succinate dehydrogenase, cytochrome b556 subunit [Arsenicitalea aurantiaca]
MTTSRPRPTSPHLSVYHFALSMILSIVHRITGVALYVGTLLLMVWIAAAAISPEALEIVHAIFGSWFGQLVLFGYTWALFHHLLGGLRYLLWDTANGMDHPAREWIIRGNLAGSILLTLLAWAIFVWF